jgi:hypothetical protein
VWLLGLVIATTGCAGGPDEPSPGDEATVTRREPLWEKSGVTLWPGGHVPVCFDPAVPNATRTLVRNAITNSWMRVANVDFSGFGTLTFFDCRSDLGKVIVATDASFSPGQGSTSFTGFPGTNASTTVRIALNNPSQRAILHEFGHVLGLISESVTVFPLSSCFQRSSGGTQLTPFDEPNSIMAENGCNTASVLSPLDIVGAQVAYGERLTGSAVGLNSQCLEASGMPAGTPAHYVHCSSTTRQRWRRDTDRHLFIPALTDGFLDVEGGSIVNNAEVQTFTKNVPTTVNQQWSLDNVSVVGLGGKCADVPGSAFANGTQLQIFTCNGGSNQKWTVDPDGVVKNGSFCWDVPNAQTADGTILQIFSCNGGSNQKFVFTSSGQMTFGGKCIDVQGGLPNDGARLQLFTCKAASDTSRFNQRFHVSGPISVGGTACLDIPAANTAENVAAQIFSCSGGSNQTWDFYPGL